MKEQHAFGFKCSAPPAPRARANTLNVPMAIYEVHVAAVVLRLLALDVLRLEPGTAQ